MKHTVEEAAHSFAESRSSGSLFPAYYQGFIAGAEWQSMQSPWISVKERLPKDFKTKLILLKNGKVRTALLDSNYYPHNNEFEIIYFWHDREANESFDLEDVVAWMPIPSFDEILEANKDVLERIKEKGD
jgi:hypothetical protein|nr:MAG: Protein of unknown function (DUF551) [Bacteriophage sp.]